MKQTRIRLSEMESQLVGRKSKEHIVNKYGTLLIPAGTELTHNLLHLLRLHDIPLEELQANTQTSSAEPESISSVRRATEHVKDLFERISVHQKVPISEIEHELMPVVQQAASHSKLFELINAVKAKDEYTHQHNLGVGVLSALLGQWLKLEPAETAQLTLAATLHDLGKLKVSTEILLKPGKLAPAEFEEMKRHTIYGYEMLKDTRGAGGRIALVALQHHERAEGAGYPLKLQQSQTDPFSRIVAVADVFHALSSRRPYHEAMPFFEVVRQMRQESFGKLDPYYVSVFLMNMIQNLVGQQVMLTDGRLGEVIYINPDENMTPLVKVQHVFVDLAKEQHIQIERVIA